VRVRFIAASAAILALTASAVSACGSTETTKTVTVTTPAASTTPATSTSATPQRPAKRTTHTRSRAAKTTKAPTYSHCDANIRVRTATTTCPFAQNVFLAYWTSQDYDDFQLSAYSPATGTEFDVDCTSRQTVVCTSGDGSEVSFPESAVDAYDLAQAKHFVSTHDVGDDIFPWTDGGESSDSPPSETTSPTPSYSAPDTSSTPPGENIPNYDNGNGYRVHCADGTYSHSGGIQGACSHHGGVG
jgi:hypothetical protein